jgi:hypothetical protein
VKKPLHHLLVSAFVYAGLGVASGLFYREFTKLNGFPEGEFTQLGLAHTHLLALGFFPFLILLGSSGSSASPDHAGASPGSWASTTPVSRSPRRC